MNLVLEIIDLFEVMKEVEKIQSYFDVWFHHIQTTWTRVTCLA